MFKRALHAVATSKSVAGIVGWRWAIAERLLRAIRVKEVKVKVRGLRKKVTVRMATSDMYEFNHLLGRDAKPLNTPANAKFIIDAGANVGYSVLRFKLDYPDATIVAIEPAAENAVQFNRNCGDYPEVTLERAALWPHAARLRIGNPLGDQNAYQMLEDPQGDISGITVQDVILRHSLPRIDILKIDIEGSEKVLFESSTEWLACVGVLLIETHDRLIHGCTHAIDAAVSKRFEFRGILDENSYYVNREIHREFNH